MNISYKWLKHYIDTDLTPDEVSVALTSLGLEVGALERVETIRGGLRGLVVGHVLTCIEHPNSDHLHITTVDLGNGEEPVQIVCGAPNVAAGQKVIVATLGTKLYDGDKEFTIKRSKMRGEESLGMICAEDEIGVGTSHDASSSCPTTRVWACLLPSIMASRMTGSLRSTSRPTASTARRTTVWHAIWLHGASRMVERAR